jgi:two-component system, OmpR family, phosphate regulon sensor histidine kinase PhoR
MSARRIQLIILLMSIALIGIICLQIYWIRWNIRLNEEQFDKNVFMAINHVADRLQMYEERAVLDAINSSHEVPAEANRNIRQAAKFLENGFSTRKVSIGDTSHSQANNTFNDIATRWEYMKVSQLVDAKPLAERVPLDLLAQSIKEEMDNRGIHSLYQYGVFSKVKNSYVIVNDHFVVLDNGPQITNGGAASLFNSPYRVSLFQQDIESPGYLSMYFPNRTSLVLANPGPVSHFYRDHPLLFLVHHSGHLPAEKTVGDEK